MLEDKHCNRTIFPTRWILIVEDNIEMQAMLLSLVRKRYDSEGTTAASAVATARHAIALLADPVLLGRLHCILCDFDTQWGNGEDLMKYIKEHTITTPICGISGIPFNNERFKALGAHEATNKLDFVGINIFLDNVDKRVYLPSH